MRLSLDGLWVAIAILLPALVALLVPMPAVDLAYQVRAGHEILATGTIPAVDTWTFTVWGTPWLDQQWLAQVLLAWGHALGGWELLAVVRAGLVALTTGLLVGTARVAGGGARSAAILALVAFALMAPALALRPQLLGIVLFALVLFLVAGRHRWPAAYWLAPWALLLWANVHGSFILGPLLLGYAWLDDALARRPGSRRSALVLVAGTLVTLVNPFLAVAWQYAIGIGASPSIAGRVSEWQRTTPFAMPGILFYPSLVATFALMVVRRDRLTLATWALGIGMAVIGVWAVRGVAWWAMAMVFLLATVLAPRMEAAVAPTTPPAPGDRAPRRAGLVNVLVVAVMGIVLVAALPWWRAPDPLTGRAGLLSVAPTSVAQALAEVSAAHPGLRVAAPQTWTSWLEWAAPDARYYLDSRFELYPFDTWDGYDALLAGGAEARAVVDRWGVEAVVVAPGYPEPDGPWAERIETPDGTILLRDPR